MPDVAIVNQTVSPEPKDYTLTGTQELLLKSVRATVDGSAAASAFLPTLQLLAPDGTVMWEAVPASTVAAGGSADVSWFPRVGGGSGGTTTVNNSESAYVWGIGTTMGSIPSGPGSTIMKWRHFQTTNTSVFGTDTGLGKVPPYHNADSDSYLYFNKSGPYVVSMSVLLPGGAYAQAALHNNVGSQWLLDGQAFIGTTEDIASNVAAEGAFGQYDMHRSHLYYVDNTAGPGVVNVFLAQTSGAAQGVVEFNMGAHYLGGTQAALSTIY